MRTCLCVLAAGQIPIMSELLHEVRCQCWTGGPKISETPLIPTAVASVLTNRSWPIRYHTVATAASRFWAGTILHWDVRYEVVVYSGKLDIRAVIFVGMLGGNRQDMLGGNDFHPASSRYFLHWKLTYSSTSNVVVSLHSNLWFL